MTTPACHLTRSLCFASLASSLLVPALAQQPLNIHVDTHKSLNPLTRQVVSAYSQIGDQSLLTPQTIGLMRTGGFTSMLYPAGWEGVADSYHWSTNSLTPHPGNADAPRKPYADPANNFGHLVTALDNTGITPVIQVNYGSNAAGTGGGEPKEAAAWVAYANGAPASTQVIGPDSTGTDWKTVGFWATLRASSPLPTDDGYNFLRIRHPRATPHRALASRRGHRRKRLLRRRPQGRARPPRPLPTRLARQRETPQAQGTVPRFLRGARHRVRRRHEGRRPQSPDRRRTHHAHRRYLGSGLEHRGPQNRLQGNRFRRLPLDPRKHPTARLENPRRLERPPRPADGPAQDHLGDALPGSPQLPRRQNPTRGALPHGRHPLGLRKNPVVTALFAADVYATLAESGIANASWYQLHENGVIGAENKPNPAYFGTQMFHIGAFRPGDAMLATTGSTANLTVHAVHRQDGLYTVLLINKDASTPAQVKVAFEGATLTGTGTRFLYGPAQAGKGSGPERADLKTQGNDVTFDVPPFSIIEAILPGK